MLPLAYLRPVVRQQVTRLRGVGQLSGTSSWARRRRALTASVRRREFRLEVASVPTREGCILWGEVRTMPLEDRPGHWGLVMPELLAIILIPLATIVVVLVIWRVQARIRRHVLFQRARRQFHRQRERLEAKLVRQIAVPVVAGEVEWADCEFDDEVLFLRERRGGRLAAVVLVTLGTETSWLPPADPESRRCGVAVFRFEKNGWIADPKVYMNLTPEDVVREFAGTMEVLWRDTTRRV